MYLHQNFSLKPYNSFGINAMAKAFASFNSIDSLQELLNLYPKNYQQLLVLGGGSNLLLTKDFNGLVIKNNLSGIQLVKEDDTHYYVHAAAGENWHTLVMHCVNNNYYGIENLSLIPGCCGAAPIQNIGAYGVELKDIFYSTTAINIHTLELHTFYTADCNFGYRESIFKSTHKNQFVITGITLQLYKQPKFNTQYGAIEQELTNMLVQELTAQAIAQAVINIRTSKLPNPTEIGNAGSFFKNPVIPTEQFLALQKEHPNIAGYVGNNNTTKIAAGWLIEQCGWKGYRKNDAGCHAKQALVLVNYGNATGTEIFELSEAIIQSVQQQFKITLEREVNIL